MAHSQKARTNSGQDIGRSLLLAVTIVGGVALTGADEVLTSAPFIALHETLGFWLGLIASIGMWAALGLATLIAVDLIWPAIKPTWEKIQPKLQSLLDNYEMYLYILLTAGLLVAIVIFFREIIDFLGSNLMFLALLLAVIAGVFVLLLTYSQIRMWVERFAKFVPNIARKNVRLSAKLLAGLIVLVYLGPVFSRPFLVPLGVTSKGWAYVLTFVAAPAFAGFWYPFYNLGVWDLIKRILF